jgi:hypothetical protein
MNRQKAGAEKQPLAGKNQTPGTFRPFKRHTTGAIDETFLLSFVFTMGAIRDGIFSTLSSWHAPKRRLIGMVDIAFEDSSGLPNIPAHRNTRYLNDRFHRYPFRRQKKRDHQAVSPVDG